MFTNNFIDLGILSMSAISYVVYNIDDFQLMSQFDHYRLQPFYVTGATSSKNSPAQEVTNHFWHIQSVTAPSPCTAQVFFFHMSLAFLLFSKQ